MTPLEKWRIGTYRGLGDYEIEDVNGDLVIERVHGSIAALVAAAPELLAALRELVKDWDDFVEDFDGAVFDPTKKARAIIARSELIENPKGANP